MSQKTQCQRERKENIGGPHYMRSFYLRICVYAIENDPFFIEPILNFMVILGLFICKFVICEPNFFGPYLSNITRSAFFVS